MMRIIRALNFNRKNPHAFQNLLQGYKSPSQQIAKMSVSSDVLKEKLSEDNLNGDKKVNTEKEMDMYEKSPPETKNLNIEKKHYQLPTGCTPNFLIQNKENLLKLIVTLNSSSAVLFMKNLCSSRMRSLDILNALSDRLQINPPQTLIECSAVLYSAAVLNFRDVNLIKKIGQQIIDKKSEFTSHKLPANIMRSLGALKYDGQDLIEVLLGSILFHKPDIPEDLVTTLTSLALVNIDSPYTKSLIQMLSGYKEIDFSHPGAYLNFIWSCVILNEYNPEHISRVLSQDFLNKILDSDKQMMFLLKLQNLHGAATTLVKSYNGPLLKQNYLYMPKSTKSKSQFLEGIKNSLYYICPKDGFLKFSIETQAGFVIDVGCNVSPQGEIVKMKQNKTDNKVGVLLLDFHDYCLGGENLTGISAFKKKITEAKGYKTLLIPYTEFDVSARLSEKIDYLRKKFRTIV